MGGCVMCGFSFTKAVLILAQTTVSALVFTDSSAESFLVVALGRDQDSLITCRLNWFLVSLLCWLGVFSAKGSL